MLRGWGATPTYKTIAIGGSIERRFTERYEGLWRSPLKPTTSALGKRKPGTMAGLTYRAWGFSCRTGW